VHAEFTTISPDLTTVRTKTAAIKAGVFTKCNKKESRANFFPISATDAYKQGLFS
jgi:hypothetical protein